MRFSLRKAALTVGTLVVLQLGFYVWFSLIPRARPPPSVQLTELRRQLHTDDSCHRQNCPQVKEGMLNLHLVPHSHDDVGWLRTVDQYYTGEQNQPNSDNILFYVPGQQCVRCTLNTTITELLKDPQRRFSFIEMAFFSRYWEEADNARRQEITQLIKDRRLEIVNGGWVMSDAAVTYYNDIIDQHTLGFDYLRDILGTCAQSRVAWHVDQFGHSREHASIFAQMGFDALIVGRIDFEDHKHRQLSQTMEFVWDTSSNDKDNKGNLFTHVTFDGYYAPKGFVLDGVKDLFNTFGYQTGGIQRVNDFIQVAGFRAPKYRTQHLLMPMGSDFGYREASDWFTNMDKLIALINFKQIEGSNVNALYSTPSCYIQHVNRADLKWEVMHDDFHPYAIEPGYYWTGYFTSRGGQKLLIKRAGAVLQACKQLGIFAGLQDAFNRTNNLRKAVAVMQHHDAITGTEKQHVSDDYNKMLSAGIDNCHSVIEEAYKALMMPVVSPETQRTLSMTYCPDLNISQCIVTESSDKFLVTVYNPLSRPVSHWLRLPVTQDKIQVEDSFGQPVPFQLLPVPSAVQRLPQRQSESDTELVFHATLPAMGYTSFLVTTAPGSQKPTWTRVLRDDIVIENKYLKVTFDGTSGRMKSVNNLATGCSMLLSQDFAYYKGVQFGMRSSGAYVFIPEKEVPVRVGGEDPVSIRLQKGPLVQEVHQQFSSWVSQVVRLYNDSRHVELQWTVGPIPTRDKQQNSNPQGREVVSFFSTDLNSGDAFYTDSNGREIIQRRLNHRETWNLTVVDPISGNYYPVASRIYIQDVHRDTQLTVLPDRPQGGSSLHPGTIELMVHRRLLRDDGLGVGEPLNEQGPDKEGIVYTGKHYLFVDAVVNSVIQTRQMALNVHFSPTLTFTTVKPEQESLLFGLQRERSFLRESVTPNIQVLTLDYTRSNATDIYLLRLEHIYEAHDSVILSTTASVSLKQMFTPFDITEVEEVSLGGNNSPESLRRLKWSTVEGHTNPETIGSSDYNKHIPEPFKITLEPMEIRTFRIYVTVHTGSFFL